MLNRSLTLIMVAWLAAAACLPTAHAAEESPGRLYGRGLEAFEQGLYGVAAANFADYIAAYPSRRQAGEVALLLAESNLHLGRHADAARALDWLEQSRWSRRTRPEVAYWRAQLALRTGRTDEALAAFAAFLDEYPEHERAPYARLGVGQARLVRGDLGKALTAFEAVIAGEPRQAEAVFLAALGKARCLIRSDKVDEARTLILEAMDKLEARAPVRGEAFLALGEASYRLDKHAEALEYYKKSFVEDRLYAWYPEALYGIAWCRIELGEHAAAREVLDALAADYPDDAVAPQVALTTIKLDMLEARHDEALLRLRSFLDANPPAPLAEEASYLLADALLASNKLDEAAARYEAFLAAHPESAFAANAQYGLAMARLRSGQADEAIALLEAVAAAAEAPLAQQALRRLAEHLFAAADYERAAGYYRALRDPERVVRQAAINALGRIGTTEATERLAEILRDASSGLQSSAARALGRIGGFDSLHALLDHLHEADRKTVERTVEALTRIGDAAALLPLICLFHEIEDETLRGKITIALAALSETESPETVLNALTPRGRPATQR